MTPLRTECSICHRVYFTKQYDKHYETHWPKHNKPIPETFKIINMTKLKTIQRKEQKTAQVNQPVNTPCEEKPVDKDSPIKGALKAALMKQAVLVRYVVINELTKKIAPMCGMPDAGDGCRAILKYLESLRGDNMKSE